MQSAKSLEDGLGLYRSSYQRVYKLPVHVLPSPSKPFMQRQTYDPSMLVHSALESHSLVSGLIHSSISERNIFLVLHITYYILLVNIMKVT